MLCAAAVFVHIRIVAALVATKTHLVHAAGPRAVAFTAMGP
jgi:hypothetical protein